MTLESVLVLKNHAGLYLSVALHVEEGCKPKVAFYDRRYKHTPLGQKISDYYLETLLRRPACTLALHASASSDWSLNKEDFAKVRAWLAEEAKKLP